MEKTAPNNKQRNTRQRKAYNSSRSGSRKNPNALTVSSLSPMKISAPRDPPSVERSIRITKLIQIQTPTGATATAFDITISKLMAGVPGGLTYWNNVRLESLKVWGEDDDVVNLTVLPQSGWNQPPFAVQEAGVEGNKRPVVGVKLGLLDRSRWWGTADTTVLATLVQNTQSQFIIQATIELMSPVGA